MIDYAKKGYKIAVLALVLALIGWSLPGISTTNNYFNNTTCSNCSVNQSSLNEKINKTGDTVGENFYLNNTGFINLTTNYNLSLRSTDSLSGEYDGKYSLIRMHPDNILINFYDNVTDSDVNMLLDDSGLDLDNTNLTNCANCYMKLINRSYNSTGSMSKGTTTIPHDDTIPTITEGFNILNLTITPKSANNYLKICSQVVMSTSSTNPNLLGNFVLYNNTTVGITNAYSPAAFYEINTGVCAFVKANTTNSVYVQSRAGSSASGTVTINGAAEARTYGGSYNTYLVVDEYIP